MKPKRGSMVVSRVVVFTSRELAKAFERVRGGEVRASVFTAVNRQASKEHICPTAAFEHLISRSGDLLKMLFNEDALLLTH